MPIKKKPTQKKPIRKRPAEIKVMATDAEKRALERAARNADMPLSTYVRKTALERALATLNERMAALKKRDGKEG